MHSQCDDKHASDLLMIAESLAQGAEARKQIAYGARAAIALRIAFWDAMLARAGGFVSPPRDISETMIS